MKFTNTQSSKVRFERIMEALRQHTEGRFQEAETLYRDMLEEDTEDPNALHLLGMLAHQVGYTRSGIKLIHEALTLVPGSPVFNNNLGHIYLQLKELDKAQEYLLIATRLNPDLVEPLYNLAECYRMSNQMEQAKNCLQLILDKEPQHTNSIISLGLIHFQLNRSDSARQLFELALSIDPDHVEANFHLARTQYSDNLFSESAETLQRVLELDPDYTPALNNQGNTYMEMRRFEQATEAYMKAVDRTPDDAGMRYNLALALTEQRHFATAIPHLDCAAKLAPQNQSIQTLLQETRKNIADTTDQVSRPFP